LWRKGQANRSKSQWDEPPHFRLACVDVWALTVPTTILTLFRKALEAHSLKLRNETDLDALNDELVSVVRETMQPAHVSLRLHSRRVRNQISSPY
jgi:hypothetical protein